MAWLTIFPMTPHPFRIKSQLLSTAHDVSLKGYGYFSILVPPQTLISMTLNTARLFSSPQNIFHVAPLPETYFTTLPHLTTHLSSLIHPHSASPLRHLCPKSLSPSTCSNSPPSSLLSLYPPHWIVITFYLFFFLPLEWISWIQKVHPIPLCIK